MPLARTYSERVLSERKQWAIRAHHIHYDRSENLSRQESAREVGDVAVWFEPHGEENQLGHICSKETKEERSDPQEDSEDDSGSCIQELPLEDGNLMKQTSGLFASPSREKPT